MMARSKILKNENDFRKDLMQHAVLEKIVTIKKEISIIIAINEDGETAFIPRLK